MLTTLPPTLPWAGLITVYKCKRYIQRFPSLDLTSFCLPWGNKGGGGALSKVGDNRGEILVVSDKYVEGCSAKYTQSRSVFLDEE